MWTSGFTIVPAVFWASDFEILGGAKYTERLGVIDTLVTREGTGTNSGFGDLFVAPLGLSWGLEIEYSALMVLTEAEGKMARAGAELWLIGLNPEAFQRIRASPLGQALKEGTESDLVSAPNL
jgi:hypothetical protein